MWGLRTLSYADEHSLKCDVVVMSMREYFMGLNVCMRLVLVAPSRHVHFLMSLKTPLMLLPFWINAFQQSAEWGYSADPLQDFSPELEQDDRFLDGFQSHHQILRSQPITSHGDHFGEELLEFTHCISQACIKRFISTWLKPFQLFTIELIMAKKVTDALTHCERQENIVNTLPAKRSYSPT